MENSWLRAAAPSSINVTVGKGSREYLTDREVERLIEAAERCNRPGWMFKPSAARNCRGRKWRGP
jgi:hypothetical protein